MAEINFIDINPSEDEQLLVNKFEELTEKTLYPAQDERILIQLIAYYGSLLQIKFNSAAKLGLVKYSRYPILDFLGEQKNCKRLENETDENYIKRILLSPEGYSCAGPELAYIYFILSAHSSITDAAIDVPDENASIFLSAPLEGEVPQSCEGGIKEEFITNTISNSAFSASMDFEKEEIEITLNQALEAGGKIKVRIPHPYKVIPYVLTDEGAASDEVLAAVSETLKDVRPLTDYVIPKSAEVINFEISGTVYLTQNADENTVKNAVNEALNAFLGQFKNKLNKSVRKNKIRTAVCNIEGVFDFKLNTPETSLDAAKNINYKGAVGALIYERVNHD